jgi:hypothetical protein
MDRLEQLPRAFQQSSVSRYGGNFEFAMLLTESTLKPAQNRFDTAGRALSRHFVLRKQNQLQSQQRFGRARERGYELKL